MRCPGLAPLKLTLLQPEAACVVNVLHLIHKSVSILVFSETADEGIAEEYLSMDPLLGRLAKEGNKCVGIRSQ
jgi:hypothetical protein